LSSDPPLDERLLFRFLREAPRLPGAGDLGVATGPVRPWPHQHRVVREVVRRYPESFLFCDEVGLGKTVEVGLALRQLVISGRVRRALVLAPRAILRQWQEELHEKLVLEVPRLDGDRWVDVAGRETAPRGADPWHGAPILLASSQLARRRDRRDRLLAAEPWDLVVVDEAHHARRAGAGEGGDRAGGGRPNRFLELLAGAPGRPGLKDRTRCLYLLTATPMQVHPVEVWDLLKLLGLGGRWGARSEDFLRFFAELRRPFDDRDWRHLLSMTADHLELSGGVDPAFRRAAERRLGADGWRRLTALLPPADGGGGSEASAERTSTVRRLDNRERAVLDELVRRHTPLATFAWRSTRELLRRYRREGLLDAGVPDREPRNVWIDLGAEERALYRRIEEYVSEYFHRYEAERRGLGFVMTVYRRRLTSSFHAVRRSLERRLERLDAGEEGDEHRDEHGDERARVEELVAELRRLGDDSKLGRLRADLRRLLAEHHRVLVFTQYTDTLDHLRSALRADCDDRVACYSGRGGERPAGGGWEPWGKEELRHAFGAGEIRVLLATEAASEGLNLQSCGVLVNYDMPWNPMRVEQRIGRLDRIGQKHPTVLVFNYFYRDTVEAEIYRRLGDRIRWFEEVVGTLQPILHRVGESIRAVAMEPGHRRDRALAEELASLGRELDGHHPEVLELAAEVEADFATPPEDESSEGPPPVTPAELEEALTGSPTLGPRFTPDPELAGVHRLRFEGEERRVTFDPALYDRHPYTLELLTYGNPCFERLLRSVGDPAEADRPTGVGLYRTRHPAPVSLFLHRGSAGIEPVASLAELRRAAGGGGRWRPADEGEASAVFSRARRRVLRAMNRVEERRRRAETRALEGAAGRLLLRAAMVELARARRPTLFEEPRPYRFGAAPVHDLESRGEPFPELFELAGDDLGVDPGDPYLAELERLRRSTLDRRWQELADEGRRLLERRKELEEARERARLETREPSATGILERRWLVRDPEEAAGDDIDDGADPLPFRPLDPEEVDPYRNAVPLYEELAEAVESGADDPAEEVTGTPDEVAGTTAGEVTGTAWVALDDALRARPAPGLFVAPAPGAALDPKVPEGAWCLFRRHPRTLPEGRVVVAAHPSIEDPDHGGRWTLRILTTELRGDPWPERRIRLDPATPDPRYPSLVLDETEAEELRLVAELVTVFTLPMR